MDKIINHFGLIAFEITGFSELYKILSAIDADKSMKNWTRRIGVLTIAITVMTLLMLIINVCQK
ncbi:hypothetical protein RBH29_17055 [Herbivorax sp. ANBcel31]|uniref:hypothetical protein n=1 Tax=Herbivorax sp. ANBcel31 TaxID=3069754 RepID=UPI0027AF2931|nr:hypothetical protein [Herbivorax sp. ANBcel31]MDQ2088136.1 hypothetical protein [Herbivorax sp. ANBcel31]